MLRLPALLVLLVCVSTAHAVVSQDCALPASECTLGETARQAHVYMGAITNRFQSAGDRALLAEHFNAVTAENEMKWGVIAPATGAYDFTDADAIADFAAANGLRLRGHTLVWGRLQLPGDLAGLVAGAVDPAALLRELLTAHMTTMLARYGDRVALWDVVNEPLAVASAAFDENLFFQTLGSDYVAEVFTLAHALDPDAELFLNEFSLSYPSDKLTGLVTLVSNLLGAGVPIHGIGIQAHFFPFFPLPTREVLEASLQSLATLGLPIELTELDISIWHFRDDPDPLAAQAAFYGDVVGACMAVPQCRAVTVWGLKDSATWLDTFSPFDAVAPNAPLLFDGTGAAKPAYFSVREAIRTRATAFADQVAALRAELKERRRVGEITGKAVRSAGRHLLRARRALARNRFPMGCEHLVAAADKLALASGSGAAAFGTALATLRADLRCDEPA